MKSTDSKFSRLILKQPFASGADAEINPISNTNNGSGDDLNFIDGFKPIFSQPVASGGKYVTRGMMNAIGNLASQSQFYYQAGGVNSFDQDFAQLIGGYPEGAVLDWLVGTKLFKVVSLHDDNMYDFTGAKPKEGTDILEGKVDGVNWAYANMAEPESDNILVGRLPRKFGPCTTQYIMSFIAPKSGILELRGTFSTNPWIGVMNIPDNDPIWWLGCGLLAAEIGEGDLILPYLSKAAGGTSVIYHAGPWKPFWGFTRFGYFPRLGNSVGGEQILPQIFAVEKDKKYAICSISGEVAGNVEGPGGITEYGDLTKSIAYDVDMGLYIV